MKYNQLKSELEGSLSQLTPVITAIDSMKNNRSEISPVDAELIYKFKLTSSIEVVALMLESKARKRNSKIREGGYQYNPFILSSSFDWDLFIYEDSSSNESPSDIENFCKYLAGIPDEKPFHYDIIFRPEDFHSAALQIDSNGQHVRLTYIDSAKDLNKKAIIQLEKAVGADYKHNYLQGNIQNTGYGCSIFSIQNLNKMSRKYEQNNHSYLTENTSFNDLSPDFIKHIQSIKGAISYNEANQNKTLYIDKNSTKTFKEHIDDFTITLEVGSKTFIRNYSLLYKMHKYLNNALVLLNQIDENELEKILSNRKGQNILDGVYDEMGLNSEEKEAAQGLYNQYQIRLLLDYQIPKDKLNGSECFLSKQMSKQVFKYITQFDDNIRYDEKVRIAQERFELIKNFNIYQIAALHEYNQQADVIAGSPLWQGEELSKASYECIKKYADISDNHLNAAVSTLNIANNYFLSFIYEPSEVIERVSYNNNSALELCIEMQNNDLVKKWLELGAIKATDISLLEKALQTNNEEIITTIILAGVNITEEIKQAYSDNFTPDKINKYLSMAQKSRNRDKRKYCSDGDMVLKDTNSFSLVSQAVKRRYKKPIKI
jgi:hypothetical protein